MERAKRIAQTLLHPPVWVLILVPLLSFGALAAIFARQCTETVPAYLIYGMSAYSLTIWCIALPPLISRAKSRIMGSKLAAAADRRPELRRYFDDPAYRGSVSLYQGVTVNFLYVAFRVATGVRYSSVWFLSIAVYYFVLGALRLYLIVGYRRRSPARERRCYRTTAWLLLLLNLPMGGMIAQMIWKNTGFSYPGYIIYLSALYTFYTMITAMVNLVKFRRLGSPILSAAKVLNFVAALMSILGLQTAMLTSFSANGEGYRRMMNAITGGFVCGGVILIAALMLLHSRKLNRMVRSDG